MADELTAALRTAVRAAEEAGALLLEWFRRLDSEHVRVKNTERDLVTTADLESEELILSRLRAAFPDDGVFAEESGTERLQAAHVWYVDPLDGTTNFVHGLPMFAVSIARVTAGRPDVAVVHVPVLEETFRATRGGGAHLGDRRLEVSGERTLRDALLATGFPYRRHRLLDNNLENFNRVFLRQRGVRRMGSAAVDLAYTAAGRLDAFWELHLGPYDVAAGGLLVEEAGGVVDTLEPGGDWIHDRNVIAGPAPLADALREVLLAGRDTGYPPLGEMQGPGV